MPALGKEIERQLTSDELALREIQGYIDRVERQVETQQPQIVKPQQAQVNTSTLLGPSIKNMPGVAPINTKQKITLPLDQVGVESGLKSDVIEGVRWLSEWCVMMIKKYPGRVFYMSKNSNQ